MDRTTLILEITNLSISIERLTKRAAGGDLDYIRQCLMAAGAHLDEALADLANHPAR